MPDQIPPRLLTRHSAHHTTVRRHQITIRNLEHPPDTADTILFLITPPFPGSPRQNTRLRRRQTGQTHPRYFSSSKQNLHQGTYLLRTNMTQHSKQNTTPRIPACRPETNRTTLYKTLAQHYNTLVTSAQTHTSQPDRQPGQRHTIPCNRCTAVSAYLSSVPVNHILKSPSCVLFHTPPAQYSPSIPHPGARQPLRPLRYTPYTRRISPRRTHPLTIVKITSS